MIYEKIDFDVSDEVLALGLQGVYFSMGGIQNKLGDPEFEEIREQTINELLAGLSDDKIKGSPVLNGFRLLHQAVGRSNRKNIASSENLVSNLLKTGRLPRINLLVDIYNLVSVKTFLAIGAHDLAEVSGNIHLRFTKGTEKFLPLGSEQLKEIGAGEYAYIDDEEDIICRLEVRQVEKTKVTERTTECFFIVQGNAATDYDYLKLAADELINLIKRFCGGHERILYAPWIVKQ
jgi:DNA/RNA-binding domain of Phe-tRNA-synthetase-like protein